VPDLGVFQRRIGGRIALVAEAGIDGQRVVAYNLHLESKGHEALRLRQLSEVLVDCRKYVDKPRFVVAGDFNLNAGDGDAARAIRRAAFHDAVRLPRPTSTGHGLSHHARAIDWIFLSDDLVSQGRVHDDVRASDHYPVSATFPR
jgi:endonuclease/exonuclease/phosphatase family metal-dependent hydrolase